MKTERFTMPNFDQLIQIAIMVNGGKIQKRKLADMIAMCEFILPRLQEHGTVEKPAKGEEL